MITQFITSENSANGTLSEIRRKYVQDGNIIENAMVTNLSGRAVQMPGTVSEDFCEAKNASDYLRLGGMREMGQSLARGMVLVFSLWNSDSDFMNCMLSPPAHIRMLQRDRRYPDTDWTHAKGSTATAPVPAMRLLAIPPILSQTRPS